MPKSLTLIDGVLVVNKPVGPSSHDVVICARRALGISRIGHTGTLDPQASGVLPLVLGQATRLAQHLSGSDKEYEATVRFGLTTDTFDMSGAVTERSDRVPRLAAIEDALGRYAGTFDQTPPLYSAKMIGGERSYVRARAGKPMQPPAVAVTVHALEIVDHDAEGGRVRLRIRCSAGFYVRSLAHDLGRAVGTGAVLDALVRTEAAGFRLDATVSFEALVSASRGEVQNQVRPIETLLADLPSVTLTGEGVRWARHGRDLGPREIVRPSGLVAPLMRMLAPDGRFVGLAEPAKMPGFLHPAVIFSYN